MPLVSIIIPVYNTEKYLKRCLDSVVNQTYKNIEIIIINDASPDNAEKIIENYVKIYKNIKGITQEQNQGLSVARNIGIKHANGEYIFFLDSDDWISKNCIQKLVDLAKSYDSKLVQCGYTSVFGSIKRRKNPDTILIVDRNLEENRNLLNACSGVWNKLYHHTVVEGFTFPVGLWYEDNAFIYPLLTKEKRVIATNEILYYYKRHLNSITLSTKIYPNEKIFDKYQIIDLIENKCKALGTYEEYKKQLDKIKRTKLLSTLLECTTWFQIPNEERKILIKNISTYIKKKYGLDTLDELQKDVSLDRIDRLRMPLLLKNLENFSLSSVEEPLEDAKRIIAKYKR